MGERLEILRGRFDGVPAPRFFIDYVDPKRGRFIVWDGPTYDAAILTAHGLEIEFGAPVVDRVLEGL